MKQKQSLILALLLYIVSAVASYGAFSYLGGENRQSVTVSPSGEEEGETALSVLLNIDPSEPKDQVCPLNGAMYTATEKEAWSKRRPLAVMIENSPDARPQSGLSDADVVYEAIAEGGVTRFMAMFYCDVQRFDTVVAPVRSARTYYVDFASGYNRPLYVHVGGANTPGPADALGQIGEYGWNGENDLNQFSIGYPTFVRDYNRVPGKEIATEHTMVSSTEKLWAVGEERGWTNMSPDTTVRGRTVPGEDWQTDFEPWTFEDSAGDKGSVSTISYEFWSGYSDYGVKWEYDTAADMYKRSQGGEEHIDLNNDARVMAANVIVLLTDEKGPIDEKKHMLYRTEGTGDALLFKHGQALEVTWSKASRTDELRFVDSKGDDVPLARGLTWISVVDKSTEVEY
ncbi:MAG TPA: DUF3048 domain-containing protein [Patescibacteria group bacterium]